MRSPGGSPSGGPRVDVIVTTYNRLAYLKTALSGVFAQTVAAWRLIVVDGGSTDGTGRWIKREVPRAEWISLAGNPGPAALMNRGVRAGSAPCVAFLESDDLWRPAFLERMIPKISAGRALIASSAFSLMDARGAPLKAQTTQPPNPAFLALSGMKRMSPFSACVFRREVFERVGPLDESLRWLGWDVDFWYRAASRLGRSAFAAAPDRLVVYRRHPGQLSGIGRPPRSALGKPSPALSRRRAQALLDAACAAIRHRGLLAPFLKPG